MRNSMIYEFQNEIPLTSKRCNVSFERTSDKDLISAPEYSGKSELLNKNLLLRSCCGISLCFSVECKEKHSEAPQLSLLVPLIFEVKLFNV